MIHRKFHASQLEMCGWSLIGDISATLKYIHGTAFATASAKRMRDFNIFRLAAMRSLRVCVCASACAYNFRKSFSFSLLIRISYSTFHR